MSGLVPVQVPRGPTEAERAETERVRDMQVRRDAVGYAVQRLTGTEATRDQLILLAHSIASFILTGE